MVMARVETECHSNDAANRRFGPNDSGAYGRRVSMAGVAVLGFVLVELVMLAVS